MLDMVIEIMCFRCVLCVCVCVCVRVCVFMCGIFDLEVLLKSTVCFHPTTDTIQSVTSVLLSYMLNPYINLLINFNYKK